jgi:hypothetical protein
MLGYAIIGHKSQGAMISSKVMIHIHESFCTRIGVCNAIYSHKLENLKIVNNLQPFDI